jgi:hypothetical protein
MAVPNATTPLINDNQAQSTYTIMNLLRKTGSAVAYAGSTVGSAVVTASSTVASVVAKRMSSFLYPGGCIPVLAKSAAMNAGGLGIQRALSNNTAGLGVAIGAAAINVIQMYAAIKDITYGDKDASACMRSAFSMFMISILTGALGVVTTIVQEGNYGEHDAKNYGITASLLLLAVFGAASNAFDALKSFQGKTYAKQPNLTPPRCLV